MILLFLDRQSSSEPMLRTYTLDSPIKNMILGLGRQLGGKEHWLPFPDYSGSSLSTHRSSQLSMTQVQWGIRCPLLVSEGTRHVQSAETYMQAKDSYT